MNVQCTVSRHNLLLDYSHLSPSIRVRGHDEEFQLHLAHEPLSVYLAVFVIFKAGNPGCAEPLEGAGLPEIPFSGCGFAVFIDLDDRLQEKVDGKNDILGYPFKKLLDGRPSPVNAEVLAAVPYGIFGEELYRLGRVVLVITDRGVLSLKMLDGFHTGSPALMLLERTALCCLSALISLST